MTKIKICFILSDLGQGGAERQTINLIKGLDSSIYDITLLLYSSTNIFFQEITELPIKLIVNKNETNNLLVKYLKTVLYLRKYLVRNDFDILHTLLFHNGFWVRLVAPKKYSKRIVYSIRNSMEDCSSFFLFFEKWFSNKSFVVTNSLKSKQEFTTLISNKNPLEITNIYNGFDVNKFTADKPRSVNREITIGTVGRQTEQKNQIQILQVINNVTKNNAIHFYLIGDKFSDRADEIKNYVSNNKLEKCVTIMDSQLNVEVYYKMFNIFVLSSIYEGCPNVLFEAMLSKCFCIISVGANSDNFVKDGHNGYVYDGSNEMLESKLLEAIHILKKEEGTIIINNGYNFAMDNFSMDRMVLSYKEVYQNILKTNKK